MDLSGEAIALAVKEVKQVVLFYIRKPLKTQKSRLAAEAKAEVTKVNEHFARERSAEFGIFRGYHSSCYAAWGKTSCCVAWSCYYTLELEREDGNTSRLHGFVHLKQ